MNKLYTFFDFLTTEYAIDYLSYLLNEPVTENEIGYLTWKGHLKSYRDELVFLRPITVRDNKIISFDDDQEDIKTSCFPNVRCGIPYEHSTNRTGYAYLIQDDKKKTYTAVDIEGETIKPYIEIRTVDTVLFDIQDLITLAGQAKENHKNKANTPQPKPEEKISFKCSNMSGENTQNYYVINLHCQDSNIDTPLTDKEFFTNRSVSREAILKVTALLLERLLNKNKCYDNRNVNQARIVNNILENYPDIKSLSKRNIDAILSLAQIKLKEINQEKTTNNK